MDNALLDVEQKTKELQALETKFSALAKTSTSVNATALSMALNAVVDTPSDSGVPVYRDSFFRTEYLARNPSQESRLQKLKAAIDELVRIFNDRNNLLLNPKQAHVINSCLKLHGSLCAPEMMSFHETLMRFFRTNFHDEILRLPPEPQPELDEDTNGPGQSGYEAPEEWNRLRSNSTIIPLNGTGVQQIPTTTIGQPSFYIPPLAFGQVPGAGIPAPPPTPGGSRFYHGPSQTQTVLQRNLARLTKYGMSSITSGPGDRSERAERTVASEIDGTSQGGSILNLGTNIAPMSSRASVQATARDVASTISAATKSRISRMGSFSWRRNP